MTGAVSVQMAEYYAALSCVGVWIGGIVCIILIILFALRELLFHKDKRSRAESDEDVFYPEYESEKVRAMREASGQSLRLNMMAAEAYRQMGEAADRNEAESVVYIYSEDNAPETDL